jgi:threonyl-tRNA synthetase
MNEAPKDRDHKKIGKELDLFAFSDAVGKGLPLWTEKGSVIRRELERFIVDEETKRGYNHVYTPEIAKLDLYKKSGHYPHYKDSMYAPIKIDEDEFMLRPMTCPHHFELYLRKPHSYKELPIRIAELARLYRYEQSGELMGLQRVRSFCLSDAHIICKDDEQAIEEIGRALDLIEYVTKTMGLVKGKDYWFRLSLGDRADTEKYYKDDASWEKSEDLMRKLLKKRGDEFKEAKGEAAFYGPKIDVQMKNANGKEDTAFTVQYDFCMPSRFELVYMNEKGEKQLAKVVHRSSVGAIERIIAFLIEKYEGAFPLWLAPVQVKVAPVRESNFNKVKDVGEMLQAAGLRVDADVSDAGFGKKVRDAKDNKIPYTIVIGDKDMEKGVVTLESRDKGKLGEMKIEEVVKMLETENKKRS